MKRINNKVNYLILCISCVLIFIAFCFFGINSLIRGTRAGFGNGCITACMNASINVKYFPNYPDHVYSIDVIEKKTCAKYLIEDNKFEVPSGYEFVGWNTSADGSGIDYTVSSCINLTDDGIVLYAKWKEKVINYGDLNLDGNISNEDYLILEKHLNGISLLNDDLLVVADVNGDSKVDNVDLDIIKHVNLNIVGYIGYLPEKIVPIYQLYKEELEDDNPTVMGPGTNGHASGNGTGGSGNSSVGSGNNNSTPNVSTNNSNNSVDDDRISDMDNMNEDKMAKTFNFKFIVDDIEYDNTSCITENSSTCKLVLPKKEPTKHGYKFNGWNLDKDCPNDVGINYSVLMDSDAIYYACFLKEEDNNVYGVIFVVFLIVMIWLFASYGIYYLIKKFKNTNVND